MIFQKGGHISKKIKLYFGPHQIEHTNQYIYLGIPFSEIKFLSHASHNRYLKARIALNNLWSILVKLKIQDIKIRQSFSGNGPFSFSYASPIWFPFTKNSIEKLQNLYARRILYTPHLTPGYILRRELDLIPLEIGETLLFIKILDIHPECKTQSFIAKCLFYPL